MIALIKNLLKFWVQILILAMSSWPAVLGVVDTQQVRNWGITKDIIADILTPDLISKNLPEHVRVPVPAIHPNAPLEANALLKVEYTFVPSLQAEARRLLDRYNPDYGVFVAIEPDTGQVLAMADSTRAGGEGESLAVKNSFPAASISKIITAVAAINEEVASVSTVIPFNGKSTSLYKKNVFHHKDHKWTRKPTLQESFAKSVNSVFGRLGAVMLGGERMFRYAVDLGFNRSFDSDFVFGAGQIELNPADDWQVAEMASGYTRRNTLSPVHGAVLGAIPINGGKLVAPVIVKSLIDPDGIPIYVSDAPAVSTIMTEQATGQLRAMMESTVSIGSARKSFRNFHRNHRSDIVVGGKTGSLTGFHPKGKYDWFVGFAQQGTKKIAYAMLCINKEKWYVKSARFAREMLEFYFRPEPILEESATSSA